MIYYLNNEKGLNMSDFKKGDIVSLKTGSEPIIVSEVSTQQIILLDTM